MNKLSKQDNWTLTNPQFHKKILILFTLFFSFVMIIPSFIVYGFGDRQSISHISNRLLNQPKQELNTSETQKGKDSLLTLGWVSGDNSNLNNLSAYKNLSVVSPELAIIDNQDNIEVHSNPSLTSTVQKQGKVLWARVGMRNDTRTNVHGFLSNQSKIQELVKKIHQTALTNHWYGVNLDIENVSSNDRNAFSQFVKALSMELSKTSIILSIDLPPDPSGKDNNQAPFDHKVIGQYCNYVVFMGYDQHWSTDPVPGPVTSLSWLKQNIQEFTQTGIPSEKLILGLPGYTRIWEQDQNGHVVKDPAEPIQYVENLVKQNHRNLSWDSTLGEYYTSYKVNNLEYKIWLPTEKSFNIYLNLISQFHLAGSAVWNLDLMKNDYWNEIFK